MKSKITLLSLLLAGWGLASAQDAITQTFDCVADTWIRESSGGEKRGTADSIELGYDGSGDTQTTRAGLLGFNFKVEDGMKVQSATVRIYSKLARTGQPVYVYAYPHDFTEGDACWNVEVDYHNQALLTDPIAQFTMGGHGGKSIYDSGINAANQSLDKWVNNIDITDYVKTLAPTTTRINIMMKHTEMSRFYPKDVSGNESLFPGTDAATSIPKLDLIPVLIVTFVEDAATTTERLLPEADTQIRMGNTANNSTKADFEIKSTSGGDRFYALLRFVLPQEVLDTENYELTGASLRLVCTQNKGDRNMNIYSYGNDFTEDTNYGKEEEFVDAALAQDPVQTFQAAGLGTMSMGDNKAGNWANFTTAEGWTSNIDLKDHVQSLIEGNTRNVNLLVTKAGLHNDAMKFASKEAAAITNAATDIDGIDAFTFPAEDLVPQLTVTYAKTDFSTAVETIEAATNGKTEYYNLQGVRVAHPEQGRIYIKVEGTKATKIIF